MAFIFYDCETTGTDRCFDQILQFAAVLTDDDLNIIDQFDIRSRILPHIVPSPKAMVVTGVSVKELFSSELPSHFEMCRRIHEVMTAWAPATIVGYNSISFDEELLRRAFYASLLPIYITNTGGNSRLDILPLAIAAHSFSSETFNWPIDEKGRVSFKLDRLAPANGFDHHNAHDALADVYATIHIARLIRERMPAIWITALAYRSKASATEFVEREPVFVAMRLRFGLSWSSLVTALGTNPDNSGELFTLDLSQDPTALGSMSDEQLTAHIAAKPRPVSSLKLNACPLFMPIDIVGARSAGHELGLVELTRRATLVRNDNGLRRRLITLALAGRKPFPESQHVEEQIYGSFYSWTDRALIDEFHRVDWPRRLELSSRFADLRLRALSRRLVYCEAPDVMPASMRADYARAVAMRIHSRTGVTGRWTTLDAAIVEARELLLEVASDREILLREHLDRLIVWREDAGLLLNDVLSEADRV
ncbi:exonuclease domain-containing protein [Mesorhizobium sp. A623]